MVRFMQRGPGISNQALVFKRDVKLFVSRTDILVQSFIFDHTPAEKLFQEFLHLNTFWGT